MKQTNFSEWQPNFQPSLGLGAGSIFNSLGLDNGLISTRPWVEAAIYFITQLKTSAFSGGTTGKPLTITGLDSIFSTSCMAKLSSREATFCLKSDPPSDAFGFYASFNAVSAGMIKTNQGIPANTFIHCAANNRLANSAFSGSAFIAIPKHIDHCGRLTVHTGMTIPNFTGSVIPAITSTVKPVMITAQDHLFNANAIGKLSTAEATIFTKTNHLTDFAGVCTSWLYKTGIGTTNNGIIAKTYTPDGSTISLTNPSFSISAFAVTPNYLDNNGKLTVNIGVPNPAFITGNSLNYISSVGIMASVHNGFLINTGYKYSEKGSIAALTLPYAGNIFLATSQRPAAIIFSHDAGSIFTKDYLNRAVHLDISIGKDGSLLYQPIRSGIIHIPATLPSFEVPTTSNKVKVNYTLASMLSQVNSSISESYEGAVYALNGRGPDYVRHVSISLRQIFKYFVDHLPNKKEMLIWIAGREEYLSYDHLDGKVVDTKANSKGAYLFLTRLVTGYPNADEFYNLIKQCNKGTHIFKPNYVHEEAVNIFEISENMILLVLEAHEAVNS